MKSSTIIIIFFKPVEIIIIMDIFCIALFFIRNEFSALYTFTQYLMMMVMYTYNIKKIENRDDC